MADVKREIRVIEEGEGAASSDSATPEAERDRPGTAEADLGATGPAESQIAMPFSSDELHSLDSENYLTSSSLGVELRQARIKRKLDLDTVAEVLRIRRDYLQAIEEGDNGKLPGPTYAVGFVRTYAKHLGLDSDDAVARYKNESENLDTQPDLAFPTPAAEARLPGTAILIGSILVAGILYGAWYFLSGDETVEIKIAETPPVAETAKTEAAPPAEPAPTPATAPAAVPASKPAPAAAVAKNTPDVSPAAASADNIAAAPETPDETSAAAANDAVATAPSESAAVPTQTATAGAARVVVSVASDSWVQIRDGSGAVVFTKLLRPGETYNVPADGKGYILLTGNAGALRLSVDGQTLSSLGDAGQVRRDIPLDADKLLATTNKNN